MIFRDRRDAGEKLAELLKELKDEPCVVIAIPRGGVEVGYHVAWRLGCPLDVTVPRKIGAPLEPELAVGAVAEDGTIYVEESVARVVGVDDKWIKSEAERVLREINRRIDLYRGGQPLPSLGENIAILVDDGIATGATIIASARFIRKLKPRKVVIAAPVAPPEVVGKLRGEADSVVVVDTPSPFYAIGQFYQDFSQLSDADVLRLLKGSRRLINVS